LAKEIYFIFMGIVGVLFGGGGLLSFFTLRLIRGYDKQIKELYERTENIPAIETDIDWLKKNVFKD
jgi:hypothetical protein